MKNKRGFVVTDQTAMIIISVIGLMVILGVLYTFYINSAGKAYDKAACQISVVANSKARLPITNAQLWAVDCPTRYVRFNKNGFTEEAGKIDYDVDFKKKGLSSCDFEGSRLGDCAYLEMVNKVIAERIFDCWEQFLAGQVNVFSNYDTSRQCVVCSVIEFDPDVVNKFGEVDSSSIFRNEEDTFDEFMRSNGPSHRDITYYEYCQDPTDHFDPEYYDYAFDKEYAIVFAANNEEYFDSIQDQIPETYRYVKALLQNTQYESETQARFVNLLHFIEQDDISQECDILAGQ